MFVLRKGETVVRRPPRLPACTLVIVPATVPQMRPLDEIWGALGEVITEETERRWAEAIGKHLVAIDGLAVEGADGLVMIKNAADLIRHCPVWVVQAVVYEIGRGSSLEGQQQRDSLPPPSGGATDPGGTAPRVDPA